VSYYVCRGFLSFLFWEVHEYNILFVSVANTIIGLDIIVEALLEVPMRISQRKVMWQWESVCAHVYEYMCICMCMYVYVCVCVSV
jgi:hypothetical protein